jgi:hypothetical protein
MFVCQLLQLSSSFLFLFFCFLGGYIFELSIPCTDGEENDGSSDPSGKLADDQVLSSESQAIEEVVENLAENTKDDMHIQIPAAKGEIPSALHVEDEKVGAAPEKNGAVTNSNGQTGSPLPKESTTKGFYPLHFFFFFLIKSKVNNEIYEEKHISSCDDMSHYDPLVDYYHKCGVDRQF